MHPQALSDRGRCGQRRDLPLGAAERHQLRKRSFDRVARLYDRVRPGYPEPLFDDLVRLSGIPEGGRVLEIGPGTGQATLPLARRGLSILGIEMGKSMARLCRRNLAAFPNVKILTAAFEDWRPEGHDRGGDMTQLSPIGIVSQAARAPCGQFDLVLAATAFHWIRTRLAFTRCAKVLKPHGSLALMWNFVDIPDKTGTVPSQCPVRLPGTAPALSDPRFYADLRGIYHRIAPQMHLSLPPELRIERQRKKIVSSGLFGPVTVLRYPWQSEYTADRYIDLLKTMSDHTILAPKVRRDIFRAIRELIADNGGSFVRPVIAVLFLAPKRRDMTRFR